MNITVRIQMILLTLLLSACGSIHEMRNTKEIINIDLIYQDDIGQDDYLFRLSNSIQAYYFSTSKKFYARIVYFSSSDLAKNIIYLHGELTPKENLIKNVSGYIVSAIERPLYSARIKNTDKLILLREKGGSYRLTVKLIGEASSHFGVKKAVISLRNIKLIKINSIQKLKSLDSKVDWLYAREERRIYLKNY